MNLVEYTWDSPVNRTDSLGNQASGLDTVWGDKISFNADDGGILDPNHIHIWWKNPSDDVNYWVGEFSLMGTVQGIGVCDRSTGKLSGVRPVVISLKVVNLNMLEGWTVAIPVVAAVKVNAACLIETVENGCGCHIDKEVGRCTQGTAVISASASFYQNPVDSLFNLFKDNLVFGTWRSTWTVNIPNTVVECCPGWAPYSENGLP